MPQSTTTFPTIPRQWTPIAFAPALAGTRPLAITVDGVPLVLFRQLDGAPVALLDRCPHRSVRLSGGVRTNAGTLRCPFHGWEFGAGGTCERIPLVREPRTSIVCATAFPCVERSGLLWLFTGSAQHCSSEPTLHHSLTQPGWFGSSCEREWGTHWSRATQTMLDVAHIPFVHPKTIGYGFGFETRTAGAALDYELESEEGEGFCMSWTIVSAAGDVRGHGWLRFAPPNGVSIEVAPGTGTGRTFLHIWCVPAGDGRSRSLVATRRNHGRLNPIAWLFDWLNPLILREDQRVHEGAMLSEIPPMGQELSTAADLPTIRFARYYNRLIRAQGA